MNEFETKRREYLNTINLDSKVLKKMRKNKKKSVQRDLRIMLNPQNELELRHAKASLTQLDLVDILYDSVSKRKKFNIDYLDCPALDMYLELSQKLSNGEKITAADYKKYVINADDQLESINTDKLLTITIDLVCLVGSQDGIKHILLYQGKEYNLKNVFKLAFEQKKILGGLNKITESITPERDEVTLEEVEQNERETELLKGIVEKRLGYSFEFYESFVKRYK